MNMTLCYILLSVVVGFVHCNTNSKDEIIRMASEIEELKSIVSKQGNVIKKLLEQDEDVKASIADLQRNLAEKSRENEALRKKCDNSFKDIDARLRKTNTIVNLLKYVHTRGTVSQTLQELNNIEPLDVGEQDINCDCENNRGAEERGQELAETMAKKKRITKAEDKVAFHASLTFFPTMLGHEHTIPFDKALSNYGSAFDTVTHTFICPISGVYFFHTSLTSEYHGHIETELVKDGEVISRVYAAGVSTTQSGHGYDQGSNAVVTRCNDGEHVWVRVRGHAGTALSADEFTSFSGFMLFSV